MVKKGKFKLLSYVIEDQLIFYKSLNRNKKILAFSIIEVESFFPLLQILKDYLEKRILKYFSIQLEINDGNKKLFLLNFEEANKNEIIKLFNKISQKINNAETPLTFLKKGNLEKMFLNIFNNDNISNLSISKSKDSILLKNHKISTAYHFYSLDIDKVHNKSSFIPNFIDLAKSFNINGYLIFSFKLGIDDTLYMATYFVEINDIFNPKGRIDEKINNFYDSELVLKEELELSRFFNFLWRYDIFNNNISFKECSELFKESSELYNFHNLMKFNSQFEANLLKQNLQFKRLNQNLLFIEQNVLFYSSSNLDSKVILKILKRYYSKFKIFILILRDNEYEKLLKINKIDLLTNVEVLNSNKFIKLDFKVFKRLS